MTWPLHPLLRLRRRQEEAAHLALGQALVRWRAADREARQREVQAAALALETGQGVEAWRCLARLRLEAERHRGQALLEAGAVEDRRQALGQVARARDALERIEASWRLARAVLAARHAEAAQDDRPWEAPAAGG